MGRICLIEPYISRWGILGYEPPVIPLGVTFLIRLQIPMPANIIPSSAEGWWALDLAWVQFDE